MQGNLKKLVHVVSFSGGRTSAFLVWLMERARKEFGWDVRYIFADTGGEHPQTYVFLRNIVKFWGINLVVLRAKVNPTLNCGNGYEVFQPSDLMTPAMEPFEPLTSMMVKYGTMTALGPYCSERMKKDVIEHYCNDTIGRGNYVSWLGIRSDEPDRLKPKPGIKYLADLLHVEKPDILQWWKHQEFDLDLSEESGNCLFCVKKSALKIALAVKRNPGFYRQWLYHINDKRVRQKENFDKTVMYRGYLSLEGIATMYEDFSEAEILNKMRSAKHFDSGSCTESCEAFKFDSEIDFDVVNSEVYQQFEHELQLGQFEMDIF
ncbi:phosphoadenosine phosphosulfate reductase family protein [Vibrio sp.]|uniref:phosphoadenosine phosphosulfate reductase domain-containing protein n=1 Tax=Vibrio sp. TaxID=678 RepID=UPI003D1511A2